MRCQKTKCPAFLKGEIFYCNYGFANYADKSCDVEFHYNDAQNTILEAQEIIRIFEKELKEK